MEADHHNQIQPDLAESRNADASHTSARPAARGFRQSDLGLLLVLAGPNVIGTTAETMLSFVDYTIVSRLGPSAQAAIQTGTLVYFTVYAFLLGTMLCVTTVVSQSLGAGRPRDCSRYAWQGLWLSVIFGLLGIAMWPAMPALFAAIGHAADVQQMEVEYTRMRMLGIAAAGAAVALGHFFNGIHQPRQNAISALAANILNGFAVYGLVFGHWGLPRMGIAGAGLGSVLASCLRVVWMLVAMCFSRKTAPYAALHTIGWDGAKIRRLLAVGWPSGVAIALDLGAWSFFMAWIIGLFGTVHLAASATCWRFTELSFMPALGIGFAVCTLVGRAIGEGRPDLARKRAHLGAILNMAYMGTMGLVFVLLGQPLMGLFSRDSDVIVVGTELLRLIAVFQLFDAVSLTYSNALRGAGDTRWPMVVGAVLAWSIMAGGGTVVALLRPDLTSLGPWAFATAYVIIIGLVLWLRWRGGRWEAFDVIGRQTGPSVAAAALAAETNAPEAIAGITDNTDDLADPAARQS